MLSQINKICVGDLIAFEEYTYWEPLTNVTFMEDPYTSGSLVNPNVPLLIIATGIVHESQAWRIWIKLTVIDSEFGKLLCQEFQGIRKAQILSTS